MRDDQTAAVADINSSINIGITVVTILVDEAPEVVID